MRMVPALLTYIFAKDMEANMDNRIKNALKLAQKTQRCS